MEAGVVVKVIKVVECVDRYWVRCHLDTRHGLVPSSCVAPVELPSLNKDQDLFVALSESPADQPGHVPLASGDLLISTGPSQVPDWHYGYNVGSPEEVGLFPSSRCWRLDTSYYIVDQTSGELRGRKVEKYAQVIQSMTAQLQDELSLAQGQVVKITHIIDKDWFRGEIGDSSGIFPASFVRIIDSFPGDNPGFGADLRPYTGAISHAGHEYSNTQPIFKGLDDGLKAAFGALPSKVDNTATSHGAKMETCIETSLGQTFQSQNDAATNSLSLHSQQVDETLLDLLPNSNSAPPSLLTQVGENDDPDKGKGYNNLCASLKALRHNKPGSLITLNHDGYINLSENLSILNDREQSQDNFSYPFYEVSNIGALVPTNTFFGGNNSGGYYGQSVNVRPYGVTKYAFQAQFENELSFASGVVLHLVRHVDQDWLEGELDGQLGIFPKSYVNIIVDCPGHDDQLFSFLDTANGEAETSDTLFKPSSFHRALHDFAPVEETDLKLTAGQIVKVLYQNDVNWCFVEDSLGQTGFAPTNHLDPQTAITDADSDGQMMNGRATETLQESVIEAPFKGIPELKFFDPLCSPDEEMKRLETQLQSQTKPLIPVPVNYNVKINKDIYYMNKETPVSVKLKERFKCSKPSKDMNIDTFISKNLNGIGGTKSLPLPATNVPSTISTGMAAPAVCQFDTGGSRPSETSKVFDISESVLSELRGLQVKPELPRDENSLPDTNHDGLSACHENSYDPVGSVFDSSSISSANSSNISVIPVSSTSNLSSIESLYATVQKSESKKSVSSVKGNCSSENLCEVVQVNEKPMKRKPPPPKPPPPRPPRIKDNYAAELSTASVVLGHVFQPRLDNETTSANPSTDNSLCNNSAEAGGTIYSASQGDTSTRTVTVEVHNKYHNQRLPVDQKPGPAPANKPEYLNTHRKLHSSNIADLSSFPPDFKASTGAPPSLDRELPVRPTSTPLKSRSVFYASLTGDSRPSLSHSYETLNGSDINCDIILRMPHRPAPPVPKSEDQEHKSRHRREKDRKACRMRKINSLKRQIQLKEKMLEERNAPQEQLLLELDMYQDIAVARGLTYDTLNRRMDRCQENIEAISDDIQRLQACLADEEMKLEEETIDELTRKEENDRIRAKLLAKKQEEDRKAREEKRRRNKEQRNNVTAELIQTEKEFCRDLKLIWKRLIMQAFNLDSPTQLEQHSVEVSVLFGNLSEIIKTSEKFIKSLDEETSRESNPEQQRIGRCFLSHSEEMKEVFTEYCVNHDKAEQLMEKYESVPEVQRLFQRGVDALRTQISCFNIGSILIKPVQRILKYPLILNELMKCTEDDHPGKPDLTKAVTNMSDIAAFINETKRKKDIVEKYRVEDSTTLTRKISKINMHSIGKKSTRMSQKLFTSLGIDSLAKDHDFEDLERRFSHLTQSVQIFSSDVQRIKEQLHDTILSQFNIAENVADLYKGRAQREVERFRSAHKNIISTYWNQFNSSIENRVMKSLNQLLETFHGPGRLIQKRMDKLFDFNSCSQKFDKNKDSGKNRQFQEELESARTTYEALNSQLLDELPMLISLVTEVYTETVTGFILARKLFVGRITKELLKLMDLPLLANTAGEILEVFLIKHLLICNQFGRFSFASKSFKPEDKKNEQSGRPILQETPTVVSQSAGHRTYLRGKYTANKLYQANSAFMPSSHFEIGVSPGDLVGVIQQKDPMGNTQRWFCDNGSAQGFVDSSVLAPLDRVNNKEEQESDTGSSLAKLSLSADSSLASAAQAPRLESKPVAVVPPYDEVAEEECKKPSRRAPPVPSAVVHPVKPYKRDCEQMSHHSYEEIAASELNSETQSQDLSPIYEEIPGGSRSSVSSSTSGSGRSLSSPRGKFFYAGYEFSPETGENTMLRVARGQVVRVIQVSGEWWYVEDRHTNRGYVPAAYLRPYQNTA